jgi:hypothetical protein
LHWATVGILQRSRVVAKQATVTFAASESDVLLDLLLRRQGLTAALVLAA